MTSIAARCARAAPPPLATCSDAPGQWASIVYPDASDRGRFETTYRFKSESLCRQAAEERIAALPDASIKKMIARAKKRGIITVDELNEALPSDQMSPDQIEDIMQLREIIDLEAMLSKGPTA